MSAQRRKPSARVRRNIGAGGAIALTHAIEIVIGEQGIAAMPAVRIMAWRIAAEIDNAISGLRSIPEDVILTKRRMSQWSMVIVGAVDGWTQYGNQVTWDRANEDIKTACLKIREEATPWIS